MSIGTILIIIWSSYCLEVSVGLAAVHSTAPATTVVVDWAS